LDPPGLNAAHFRLWPKSEVPTVSGNVCYLE
jgi:hypothetical protein